MKIPEPKKQPSGNYFIRLRLGKQSYPITRPTARECRIEAERVKAEYRANNAPVSQSNITLRKAIDRYVESRPAVLSPETIRGYRVIQRSRFPAYADKPMKSVNWQKAVNDEAKSVSAKTVANAWGLVSSVMKDNGIEVPRIKLPQKIANEHEWLTPEQIPVFLAAVKGKREELPALIALHGLRRSEIYALTADSFKDNTIHVRGAVVHTEDGRGLTKKKENKNTSSRRDVPIMIPRLSELLASDPVFFEVPLNYLTKSINNTCAAAGLPLVGTHGLRHSFASLCYHAGLSERQTMQLGGWSDPATMRKIYTHISKSDMDAASEKLKTFFAECQ